MVATAAVWLALLAAVGFFVGWDESLRPEVAQALDWQPPAKAFDDNGYLIVLGIEAAASQDPATLGAQVLRQELGRFEALRTHHQPTPLEPSRPELVERHPGLGDMGCNYTAQANCVDFYVRQDRAQVAYLLAAHKRLIDRFEAIWRAKHYTEVVPPLNAVVTSHISVLRDASELQRIQAILDIAGNRTNEGLSRFASNAAHSRRLLRESNTLISHMVALGLVHRDIRILSELLHRYPSLAKQHAALIDPVLAPISGAPYRLTRGFQHERALRLQVLSPLAHADAKSMVGPGNGVFTQWFVAMNYLPNATLNDAYALSTLILKLAEADPSQLDAVKQEIRARYAAYAQIDHTFFTRRNGTGRTLNAVGEIDFAKYVELQHDLNAFIAMVAIQRTAAPGVPASLAPWPMDPYTGQAMGKDAVSGDLVYDGRQPASTNFEKSHQYRVPLR